MSYLHVHPEVAAFSLSFSAQKHVCGKLIRSDLMITFVRRHRCVHSEIATLCIVGDHASYMQMSAPCMEISGSTRVASTPERPDGDVA